MVFSWERRIRRAEELADQQPASAEMLRFYAQVARFQKGVYERLDPGNLHPALLEPYLLPFLRLIQKIGPPAAAEQASELERTNTSIEDLLANPSEFFARALLQPYMERLANCPYCGDKPLAGVLRGEGDGAKRSLLCFMCSSEWEFRRLVCPACAEEQNDRLPVYTAAGIEYVRVEACDTCHAYIKSIDLTKNGLAVPCVDEIATVSLDLWAEEHGYQKITRNLLGN
jgi:FdhE protein